MAVHPDIAPAWEPQIGHISGTDIGMSDGNLEKRRKRSRPLRTWSYQWRTRSPAVAAQLQVFHDARDGDYEPFYLFEFKGVNDAGFPWSDIQTDEIGDAANDTFTIPGKTTSSVTVYVDDVEKTLTTHYTILTGTGSNGEDQIEFTPGNIPGTDAVVTVDFTGRRRWYVRYASLLQLVYISAGGGRYHLSASFKEVLT